MLLFYNKVSTLGQEERINRALRTTMGLAMGGQGYNNLWEPW